MQSYPLQIVPGSIGANLAVSADLFVYESGEIAPRVNLLPYTDHLDNPLWQKTRLTVVANATSDPEGGMTAEKLVENVTGANDHYLKVAAGGALEVGQKYTFSAYVKAAERTRIEFGISDMVTPVYCVFDLTAGTVISGGAAGNARIEAAPGAPGWWRIQITRIFASPNVDVYTYLYNGSSDIYPGDGTSGLYVWRPVLEKGAVATKAIANPEPTPITDKTGDARIIVKPENGAEITLRPGQRFRLSRESGKASRWLVRSYDGFSTINGSVIIGSGEFDDANTENTFKLDGTFTNQVKIVNTEYEPAHVRIDPEQVSGCYSGSFTDTTVVSGTTAVFTAAANTNGAWIEWAQMSVCHDTGAVNWLAVSLLAKATAPTGPTDGDLILFARNYSDGSDITKEVAALPTRIKIPAGKGLYLHQVANGGAALFSTKSVLYTLL